MFAILPSSIVSTVASLPQTTIAGYLLLAVSIVLVLFSSYRYLLGYVTGGMIYGLIVEVIQSGLVHTFSMSGWNGYITALALTWSVVAWIIYRKQSAGHFDNPHPHHGQRSVHAKHNYYIEHTPIYTNYEPRFPN